MTTDARPEVADWVPLVRETLGGVTELARKAFTHPLTAMLNRAAYEVAADIRDRALEASTAVVFVDLTGFKATNDRHGHVAGDACIVAAGERVAALAATAAAAAFHFGGDEFTLVVDGERLQGLADAFVPRLAAFSAPWRGIQLPVRATAGAAASAGLSTVEQFRERAEKACKAAKMTGTPWLTWDEARTMDPPVDRRWRCLGCGCVVVVVAAPMKKVDVAICPVCQARL